MAASSNLYTLSNKFTWLSFPYSADMPFTNTVLAKLAPSGDTVSWWDGTNGWRTSSKSRAGWGIATNLQLRIGQSINYKAITNRVVTETRPYTNSWN
jgi:hypothetical protein